VHIELADFSAEAPISYHGTPQQKGWRAMTSKPVETQASDNVAADLAVLQDAARELRPMLAQANIEKLTHIREHTSPRGALEMAMAMPSLFTERLLEELALAPVEVKARQDATDGDTAYFLFDLAAFLLAYQKEPRAWRLLLDFYASDCHLACDLTDFTVRERLPAMLVRCYDGSDLQSLRGVIANEAYEVTFRSQCLEAYIGLVLEGRAERQELVAFLGDLLDVPEGAAPSDWYGWLAHASAKLREPSLRPKVESLFHRKIDHVVRGAFDIAVIDLEGIAETYAQSPQEIAEEILQTGYFDSLIDNICGWFWFRQREEPRRLDRAELAYAEYLLNEPYTRVTPKLGRNEPCHCGSGMKYKKCCLEEDAATEDLFH